MTAQDLIDDPNMHAPDVVTEVAPVSGENRFSFLVNLYEYHGKVHIHWNTTFPGYVRLVVALYGGPHPSTATHWMTFHEVTGKASGTWDTGQIWGAGYSASLLALNARSQWSYINVNTPVTRHTQTE
jgi:hypothetical protein